MSESSGTNTLRLSIAGSEILSSPLSFLIYPLSRHEQTISPIRTSYSDAGRDPSEFLHVKRLGPDRLSIAFLLGAPDDARVPYPTIVMDPSSADPH